MTTQQNYWAWNSNTMVEDEDKTQWEELVVNSKGVIMSLSKKYIHFVFSHIIIQWCYIRAIIEPQWRCWSHCMCVSNDIQHPPHSSKWPKEMFWRYGTAQYLYRKETNCSVGQFDIQSIIIDWSIIKMVPWYIPTIRPRLTIFVDTHSYKNGGSRRRGWERGSNEGMSHRDLHG